MFAQAKTPLAVSDLVPLLGPENEQLILLVGLPASGKSTVGLELARHGYEYLNGDSIRKELYGDEAAQGNPAEVMEVLRARLHAALARRGKVVLDMTNVARAHRLEFVALAARYHYPRVRILVLDTPLSLSLIRNRMRSRQVPEHVILSMAASLLHDGPPASDEGEVFYLRPTESKAYLVLKDADVEAEKLSTDHVADLPVSQLMRKVRMPSPDVKLDVIGDVHGCFSELVTLIRKLGHKLKFRKSRRHAVLVKRFVPKRGRKLAFVGDFCDRGPASDKVLALVRWLVSKGHAIAVPGNHDDKLHRYLRGNPVQVGRNLRLTIDQLKSRRHKFRHKIRQFYDGLPVLRETEDLILVHAAYLAAASGRARKEMSLYGQVGDQVDSAGHRIRLRLWEDEYEGSKTIVRGHDVVKEPSLKLTRNGGWVVNVDTGCVFGGKLTALCFPEMYFVSVPAEKVWFKPDFELS